MTFKQKVYHHYHTLLLDKIAKVQQRLDELTESLKNETKSTAGDKHETARAFVHIEQANIGQQLNELLAQKSSLESIDYTTISDRVIKGSLVLTDKAYLFVSVALGKAIIDGCTVFALSPAAPLGQKLMGSVSGTKLVQNNTSYVLQEIL